MTREQKLELLGMAAKAAGIPYDAIGVTGCRKNMTPDKSGYIWNPLDDDGDCARLEAALGICINWFNDSLRVSTASEESVLVVHFNTYFKDHHNDKNAARRFASVSVAAAIVRGMR